MDKPKVVSENAVPKSGKTVSDIPRGNSSIGKHKRDDLEDVSPQRRPFLKR